jgi:hypothetical protein
MNFTCQNCHTLITIMPGDRPPPWCSKCGADFKPDDHRFAVLYESPRDERPQPPSSPPRPTTGKSRYAMPAQPAAPVTEAPAAEPEAREPVPAKRPDRAASAPDSTFGLKLLAAAGAVCLLAGIAMAVQKYEWVRGCGTATGVVVLPGEGKGTPVVRYTVGGKEYEFAKPDAAPGSAIPILYRESEPNEAVVHDTLALYRLPGIIVLLGLGALVTAGSGFALRSGGGKEEAAPRAR